MKQVAEKTWKKLEFPDMRWDNFTPETNVIWVAYLCTQLQENVVIMGKSGELWKATMNTREKRSWDTFRHDVCCLCAPTAR